MFIGNKWEWAEVCVLLRPLAEENKDEIKEYIAGEMTSIYINGEKVKELPVTEFESKYGNLLNEINSKDSKYAELRR